MWLLCVARTSVEKQIGVNLLKRSISCKGLMNFSNIHLMFLKSKDIWLLFWFFWRHTDLRQFSNLFLKQQMLLQFLKWMCSKSYVPKLPYYFSFAVPPVNAVFHLSYYHLLEEKVKSCYRHSISFSNSPVHSL